MNKLIITFLVTMATMASLHAQKKAPAFFIVQAGSTKFNNTDWAPAGSLTAGLRIKKHFGVGANLQVVKFKNDKNLFVPASLEFVFINDTRKFGPFINFQIGRAFYSKNAELRTETGSISVDIHGGLFISPGAGIMLPLSKKTRLLFTLSYVNSELVTDINEQGVPGGYLKKNERANIEGLRIALGVKF